MTLRRKQEYLIQGLHGVGTKKSKEIIDFFKSPLNFFNTLAKTQIVFNRNGKPKGIDIDLGKGINHKFVMKNKEILIKECDKNEWRKNWIGKSKISFYNC